MLVGYTWSRLVGQYHTCAHVHEDVLRTTKAMRTSTRRGSTGSQIAALSVLVHRCGSSDWWRVKGVWSVCDRDRCAASTSECCMSGVGVSVLGGGFWVLGPGYWVLGAGCWVLGAGCWVLGTGRWSENLVRGKVPRRLSRAAVARHRQLLSRD
jgi:hypothetical protein